MTRHSFEPTILREYDIRGVVGDTLATEDAYALGRAFGTIIRRSGGGNVCVGRDGRLSSPALEEALVDGLARSGLEVLRIGIGPTPMLYFAVHHCGAGGGIMVTGSHNPPDHNGFKMMLGTASFFGGDIQTLAQMAARDDFDTGKGVIIDEPVADIYLDRLLRDFSGPALAVGWDPGNGAAGDIVSALCARLPGRHTIINGDIDGSFPNHHPDPTDPDTLVQLQTHVQNEKLDMGLAFDGDGDRIGAIDGTGEIVWGDQILAILAVDVLRDVPGATIIADVKASQALFDAITACGGVPLMWRTGHSLIKSKMAEIGAPLAGEMSGHIFFKHQYYGFDDAIFAALKLIEAIGNAGRSLAQIRAAMPTLFNTPELRFPCPENRKFAIAGEIKHRLADSGFDINDIDGVRVTSPDGWWLVRASNTQDVLVARCESSTPEGLARLKSLLGDQLRLSGIEPPADL